jgi:hypothetical protein
MSTMTPPTVASMAAADISAHRLSGAKDRVDCPAGTVARQQRGRRWVRVRCR